MSKRKPKPEPKKNGRPSLMTDELLERIFDWIADGGTLRSFCRQPDAGVKWRTVYEWLEDPKLFARFTRAGAMRKDAWIEDVLDIADTMHVGERVEESEEDGETESATLKKARKIIREDALGHRKLRIEARLKLLAIVYHADATKKLMIGGDPNAPPVSLVTPDQLAQRVQALIEAGAAQRKAGKK